MLNNKEPRRSGYLYNFFIDIIFPICYLWVIIMLIFILKCFNI